MNYRKFIPKEHRPLLEQKIVFGIALGAYDLFMSLEENCLPATALKQVNLRKFSGPFDWIAKTGFPDRVSHIESNFRDFLNYEDLVFDVEKKTDQRHNACLVKNIRTDFEHPHDFQNDSEECYLQQKEKYQRHQERMYSLAKNADTLFIFTDFSSGLCYSDYPCRIEEYFSLMERLRVKLEINKLSLILGVKADFGMETNFVDMYETESLKLFVQPVPCKYINEKYDPFEWPSFFIKRALQVAANSSLNNKREF